MWKDPVKHRVFYFTCLDTQTKQNYFKSADFNKHGLNNNIVCGFVFFPKQDSYIRLKSTILWLLKNHAINWLR